MINCALLVISMACSDVMAYDDLTPEIALNVQTYSLIHNVPAPILLSVIKTESDFRQHAVSRTGAVGVMQVQPRFWSRVCLNLYTVEGNISCGAKVLRRYKKKTGDWASAIKAYNIGITHFRKGKNKQAAKRYLAKVESNLNKPLSSYN